MRLALFFFLLFVVVVPPWLFLNCSRPTSSKHDNGSPERAHLAAQSKEKEGEREEKKGKQLAPKHEPALTIKHKSTSSFLWVWNMDMVITSRGFVWHHEPIRPGGELLVSMDLAGRHRGIVLKKTNSRLECTAKLDGTPLVVAHIRQAENVGNLHEGLYALFMVLEETGHLNKPIKLGLLEKWPNNKELIQRFFPNVEQSQFALDEVKEEHPVDPKSATPPEVIDGSCLQELVVIKDLFPVFSYASESSLIRYRRRLLAAFGMDQRKEGTSALFTIPEAALQGNDEEKLNSSSSSASAKPRVVLINRQTKRKILNNQALLMALRAELGDSAEIVQVTLEKLSPEEKAGLMQSTTVLIGVHGSGLAELFFLPPTSSVVIIHPPGTQNLLSPKGLQEGAPWLVDYLTLGDKLGMNVFTHQVIKETEPLGECGGGRWGLFCAYEKNFNVEEADVTSLARLAFDAALQRGNGKL